MRLLLVEDEEDLANSLAEGLSRDGYTVDVVGDGQAAVAALGRVDYDLLVLDRDLPLLTGDSVCRVMRAQGLNTPVLMLTAAASVNDRVEGLDLGADDYMVKPFAYVELLARLRALIRRSRERRVVYEIGDLRLDTARRVVERSGTPVGLTQKEYGVIELLMVAGGGYVTVDELLEEVWGYSTYSTRGVVKTAVYTLRRALGFPDVIEAVPGRGYRIVSEK